MGEQRMTGRSVFVLLVPALVLAHVSGIPVHGGQADTGRLRIEGQGIEQLVLREGSGRDRPFDRPGPMVALPPGDYRVQSVRLQGGHYTPSHLIPKGLQVAVDANAPATLTLGAPLRQSVKVERQGPVMVLNYELIGRGGERYVINRGENAKSPTFTVYRGDSKVASGDFEFG